MTQYSGSKSIPAGEDDAKDPVSCYVRGHRGGEETARRQNTKSRGNNIK